MKQRPTHIMEYTPDERFNKIVEDTKQIWHETWLRKQKDKIHSISPDLRETFIHHQVQAAEGFLYHHFYAESAKIFSYPNHKDVQQTRASDDKLVFLEYLSYIERGEKEGTWRAGISHYADLFTIYKDLPDEKDNSAKRQQYFSILKCLDPFPSYDEIMSVAVEYKSQWDEIEQQLESYRDIFDRLLDNGIVTKNQDSTYTPISSLRATIRYILDEDIAEISVSFLKRYFRKPNGEDYKSVGSTLAQVRDEFKPISQ